MEIKARVLHASGFFIFFHHSLAAIVGKNAFGNHCNLFR
jgi:hypothetical protein